MQVKEQRNWAKWRERERNDTRRSEWMQMPTVWIGRGQKGGYKNGQGERERLENDNRGKKVRMKQPKHSK